MLHAPRYPSSATFPLWVTDRIAGRKKTPMAHRSETVRDSPIQEVALEGERERESDDDQWLGWRIFVRSIVDDERARRGK
jgi:hypothetical protein